LSHRFFPNSTARGPFSFLPTPPRNPPTPRGTVFFWLAPGLAPEKIFGKKPAGENPPRGRLLPGLEGGGRVVFGRGWKKKPGAPFGVWFFPLFSVSGGRGGPTTGGGHPGGNNKKFRRRENPPRQIFFFQTKPPRRGFRGVTPGGGRPFFRKNSRFCPVGPGKPVRGGPGGGGGNNAFPTPGAGGGGGGGGKTKKKRGGGGGGGGGEKNVGPGAEKHGGPWDPPPPPPARG